jgi:hypothetical protein
MPKILPPWTCSLSRPLASASARRLSEMRRESPRLSGLVAFANLNVRVNRLRSLRVRSFLALVLEGL